MSKLDDILKDRADTIVEIFERAVTGDYKKLIVTESLKTEIKDLMLELVGEDKEIPRPTDDESRDRFYRVSGQNFTRNEIRKRIQAL